MNTTMITGRLTKEAKFVEISGNTVANFSVANNDNSYTDSKSGERVDKVTYIECSYWMSSEKLISHMKNILQKGTQVLVSGTIKADLYIPEAGKPTAKLVLKVNTVETFLPKTT